MRKTAEVSLVGSDDRVASCAAQQIAKKMTTGNERGRILLSPSPVLVAGITIDAVVHIARNAAVSWGGRSRCVAVCASKDGVIR